MNMENEMTTVLFVGGESDGMRMKVHKNRNEHYTIKNEKQNTILFKYSDDFHFTKNLNVERYTRRMIRFLDGQTIEIYVLESLSDFEAHTMIFDGYRTDRIES